MRLQQLVLIGEVDQQKPLNSTAPTLEFKPDQLNSSTKGKRPIAAA